MSVRAPTRVLFRCDDAQLPPHLRDAGWTDLRTITTRGDQRDLNLRVEGLSHKFFGQIHPRVDDLIRIAAYAFAADQRVSRGGEHDAHGEYWTRHLGLCVPVADLTLWSRPEVTDALCQALAFGTGDTWEIAFSQRDDGRVQVRFDLDDRMLLGEPDSVALMSGGTDSLCALVDAVKAGARPVVVSHRPVSIVDDLQATLLTAIKKRLPEWSFPPLSFWIHLRGKEAAERTQRSRGFLYAALGLAVAAQLKVPEVMLPDNGYVSLNPPIGGQLVGALASRSTHPTFLRLVNTLSAEVFPELPSTSQRRTDSSLSPNRGIRLVNPLITKTRAEALTDLATHGHGDLIPLTRSCGKSRLPREKPHCGLCSQCIDRRFSTIHAGLEDYDSATGYGVDVFTAELAQGKPKTIALNYVQFAQRVTTLTPDDLFQEYAELEGALDLDGPGVGAAARELAKMVLRHADETVGVVGTMLQRHSAALARSDPGYTLLRLAVGGSTNPVPLSDVSDLPPTVITPSAAHPGPNEIEVTSGGWWVRFHGEKGYIRHSKGFERIVRLLLAPGQEIPAATLFMNEQVVIEDVDQPYEVALPDPALAVTGGAKTIHPDDILDPDYVTALHDEARVIQHALIGADPDEIPPLRAKLEWIEQVLHHDLGLGGKTRRFATGDSNARTGVLNSIKGCFRRLESEMPPLHSHLRDAISTGSTCCYRPNPPERWVRRDGHHVLQRSA